MPYKNQAYMASLDSDHYGQLLANTTQLGNQPETQDSLLISALDRFAGLYALGVQGSGKSRLFENLIAQDILMDQTVIVIDPHGDLVRHCIAQLPEDKLAKTYLLDMEDEAYPFGVNVFTSSKQSTSIAQAQAIDRVMHIFEVVWGDILTQAYLPRYLRAAIIALSANPGSTMVDMYRLLTDHNFRRSSLRAVTDPTVIQFWQSYDGLSAAMQRQQVESLIGRLESLFMGRSLVRNIVGQRETSINFRRCIENKEIIFIRLPIKTLTQDARLIGTLLLAQIHAAIFSFSDMPENKRPGFSLYVDEFQHFATPDFGEMFTEGRKFGVRVSVAHQYRGQLPEFLQASTMTARTKVCFQTTPEDAREMAHLFLSGEATVRPEDIEPRAVEHLLHYGSDDPVVQTFIDWYLRPLQTQKKSSSIEIAKPGFRAEHILYWVLSVKPPETKPRVADPTPSLNHLLYQVMKTGAYNALIPAEVVRGFANCGRGFYSDFRYALGKGTLLSSEVRFPPALVVEGANGRLRWTRRPENGKEQLYHFLFHLRATMAYLAHEPIGKKSSLSTTEVSHMLTQLPKRAAFVRSGEDVGVIYTDETLPLADAATIRERFYRIRDQTRQKYCHALEQPGDHTMAPSAPIQELQPSRWEEV